MIARKYDFIITYYNDWSPNLSMQSNRFSGNNPNSFISSNVQGHCIKALGGEVREGDGSRVALELSGKREYAHRPHPGKEAKKNMVEKNREWLTNLEVTP